MNDHLPKPLILEDLLAKLEQAELIAIGTDAGFIVASRD